MYFSVVFTAVLEMTTCNLIALLQAHIPENHIYTSHLADLAGFFISLFQSQSKINITAFQLSSLVMIPNENKASIIVKINVAMCVVLLWAVMS